MDSLYVLLTYHASTYFVKVFMLCCTTRFLCSSCCAQFCKHSSQCWLILWAFVYTLTRFFEIATTRSLCLKYNIRYLENAINFITIINVKNYGYIDEVNVIDGSVKVQNNNKEIKYPYMSSGVALSPWSCNYVCFRPYTCM